MRLDFNDARNTLLVERTRYDLIVSQPSHPWLAGAANVFTRQFWEIVKSRLNERGVFGQWINLFKMDATTLRSLVRLSALTAQPTGDEDPYAFLRRHFHLDLIPYLGSNAADRLYAQADHYFSGNDMVLVTKAAQQLAKIDPVRGRGVEYERAWRARDLCAPRRSMPNTRNGPIVPTDNMPKCWRSRAISMRRGNHCGELSTQLCASPLTLNYRLKQMAEPFYLRWCASAARYPA